MEYSFLGIYMDNQSKSAKKAQDYIQYATRQEVKHKDLKIDEHGRICVDSHKSIKIDHIALAEQFIKMANIVPGITTISRKIITTRIMNPGISTTALGLSVGMRDTEVLAYERDGLNRIKEFIGRTSFQEAVEKSNRDNIVTDSVKNLNLQGTKNSLLNPHTP